PGPRRPGPHPGPDLLRTAAARLGRPRRRGGGGRGPPLPPAPVLDRVHAAADPVEVQRLVGRSFGRSAGKPALGGAVTARAHLSSLRIWAAAPTGPQPAERER